MAFFGLFGGKASGSALRKHIERVGNKRAQDVDRWASIKTLAEAGTEEAIAGLLNRFTFYVDSSITDQEEKDAAFAAVVDAGAVAVKPAQDFLRRSETIAWPVKVLDALCEPSEVTGQLLALLREMDTEYERDPQRKNDLIAALGERPDSRSAEVLVRFLEDTNETARFNAVGSLLAQEPSEIPVPALLACLGAEESLRVKNRIVDGMVDRRLVVPEAERVVLQKVLPAGYSLDPQGMVARSAR